MKKICIFVAVILQLVFYAFAEGTSGENNICSLLPNEKDLPQWKPSGEPDHAAGNELYHLINGAAEIYHEYGFKQTISQVYRNQNQKSFNLEIYEMQNAAAAYGAYTFKTGNQGRVIPAGTDGFFEEYYLNFWKGPYVVTVIGYDSEQETIEGVLLAAKKVDEKIGIENKKPEMIHLLPEELGDQLKPNGIKYLKGNLALFNSYSFDSANIFGVKEGVMGDYRDFKLFIFSYVDSGECQKWFNNAADFLKKSSRFKGFSTRNKAFSVIDGKNNNIHVETASSYLFIVIGSEKVANNINKIIKSNL